MVRCDVQRWNMQKQIDATRYIVPYKTDDRMSIIAYCGMRVAGFALYHKVVLHCDVTPRYAVASLRVAL